MSLKNVIGFLKKILVVEILTKNGQFCYFWPKKKQVFGHFLRIHTSYLSKTWSETWDNCFDSSNGSVVSRKIRVLAVLAIFWVKNTLLVVTLYGFRLKNCLLSLYLRNRASDFDEFFTDVALNDLAAVLCKKNLVAPLGGIYAQKMLKSPSYDNDFFKVC